MVRRQPFAKMGQLCYKKAMTIEALRKCYDAQPFVPFEMLLADGRKFPVLDREFLALGASGRTLAVTQPGDDGFDILDVRLIASLQVKSGGMMHDEK
jgi:hypothetical protein